MTDKKFCRDCKSVTRNTTPPQCQKFPVYELVSGEIIGYHACQQVKYYGVEGAAPCGEHGLYFESLEQSFPQSLDDLEDLPRVFNQNRNYGT